jgi:hypothetical protein
VWCINDKAKARNPFLRLGCVIVADTGVDIDWDSNIDPGMVAAALDNRLGMPVDTTGRGRPAHRKSNKRGHGPERHIKYR